VVVELAGGPADPRPPHGRHGASLGGDRGTNVCLGDRGTVAFSKAASPCRVWKPPDLSSPSARPSASDGWNYGRGFACVERGPILTTMTRTKTGTQVVVRMQRSGKTIAVAEVSGKSGWIRGSKDCDERER
jgi:hypothetical protein